MSNMLGELPLVPPLGPGFRVYQTREHRYPHVAKARRGCRPLFNNGHQVSLQEVHGTLQFWPNMLQKREPRRQPCLVGYPLRLPSKLGIIGTTC